MSKIKCGNCHEFHESVEAVKACYKGAMAVAVALPVDPQPTVPEWAKEPATERQVSYLSSLIENRQWCDFLKDDSQRDCDVIETLLNVMDGKTIGKREASSAIERLKDAPYVARTKDDTAWPGIPEGKYALVVEDGSVSFYQVDKPVEGRWAGYVFVKHLVGGVGSWTEHRVPGEAKTLVLKNIDAMGAQESATLFGIKAKRCGRCMSPLSTLQSRAAGYGQHCAAKLGWPYPSKEEARRILQERGESIEENGEESE